MYPQSMFLSKIRKLGIPLHITVLLYKSGVQVGILFMDVFPKRGCHTALTKYKSDEFTRVTDRTDKKRSSIVLILYFIDIPVRFLSVFFLFRSIVLSFINKLFYIIFLAFP